MGTKLKPTHKHKYYAVQLQLDIALPNFLYKKYVNMYIHMLLLTPIIHKLWSSSIREDHCWGHSLLMISTTILAKASLMWVSSLMDIF